MKRVKEAIFKRMRDDTTLRALLGITTPNSADGRIRWLSLSDTPLYPSVIYKRLSSDQDQRFNDFLKAPVVFEIFIYDLSQSPETIENIKDRIEELFHNQHKDLTTLTGDEIHFYTSLVVRDSGDAYQDVFDRYYTTIRLEFILQKVSDILGCD